jgi:large subunit ribosomal protein L17
MAVIELVTEAYSPKAPTTKRTAVTAAPAPVEEAPVEEATDVEPVEEAPVEEAADVETVVEVEGVDNDVFEETAGGTSGKYAGSSVPLENADNAPEGYPIKGNEGSMKYHTPDGAWFDQTTAEVWFDTEESAQAAGFTKAGESE